MKMFICCLTIFWGMAFGQQVLIPRPSPKATVSQTVGVTEVTINYNRPAVKGREIWGKLVPFGEVWRTGANENTTITFSDDVLINGTKLVAGTYGLQSIPGALEWTIVFSKDAKLWGAFNYKPESDALRINVKPQAAEFVERMRFSFEDVSDNSAQVVLQWEKLKVNFAIDIETQNLTLNKARAALGWQAPMQVANYILGTNTNLEEGVKWVDISISITENYWNNRVKAQLLEKSGKRGDAVKTMEKAVDYSKKMQDPPFDLKAMEDLLAEWKKKK